MIALLLLACNDGPSTLEVTWEVPEREMLLGLDIPRTQDGAYIIGPDQVADPADRTPLSAAAECGAAVLACYEPAEGRDIEACLGAVPTCDTDTPLAGRAAPLLCRDLLGGRRGGRAGRPGARAGPGGGAVRRSHLRSGPGRLAG